MDVVIDLDEQPQRLAFTTPAVTVVAPDPLLRSGVAAQLRAYADLRPASSADDADVMVVVVDAISGSTLAAMLDLVQRPTGVVVVAGGLGSPAHPMSGSDVVCQWVDRAEASPYALGRAVISAWRCRHRPVDHVQRLPPGMVPPPLAQPSSATLPPNRTLSARELDVLRRIADGYSTAEIAEQLSYSESTIKNIVHQVAGALGARNRTHAVVTAIRQGLIES